MMKIKIALYADDITLFLRNKQDMVNVLKIFESFRSISGLQINYNKSECMWLGSTKKCTDTVDNLRLKSRVKILGVIFGNDTTASHIPENWNERIANIKRIIKQWEKRNLSILGKVHVIKTFLMSQLVYIMQAIVIPDKVLIEINRLFFRFLWRKKDSNKRAFEKVKRTVLCDDYEHGGLKMIDMKQLQVSFLLQWALKLCKAQHCEKWSVLPHSAMNKLGNDNACFFSDVNSKQFKGLDSIKLTFWHHVLKTWLDNNNGNASSSFLWNNSQVTYGSKVLLFPRWIRAGIMRIHDVIDNDKIIAYEVLGDKIGFTASSYLEYEVVHCAIKAYLRKNGKTTQTHDYDSPLFCNKNILTAREFRMHLVRENNAKPCSEMFWKRKFNIEFDKKLWLLPFVSTQETRLRVLQWKLLHNIYPTNILLSKMKIVDNNKCTYCRDVVDFIEHFFYECPKSRELWKKVEQLMYVELDLDIDLNIHDVLFGLKRNGMTEMQILKINHIILIAKMCISIFKKTDSKIPIYLLFCFHARIRLKDINI
jgi:hypothetical protein